MQSIVQESIVQHRTSRADRAQSIVGRHAAGAAIEPWVRGGFCAWDVGRWALAALTAVLLMPAVAGAAGLTNAAGLAAAYDAILDAQFQTAAERLKDACPPAPFEACLDLAAASLWWQVLITPDDRSRDQALESASAAAIAAAERWSQRQPERAEAWFYLAGAYAPRVQLRVLRGNNVSAAVDGNRIRVALERALQLDPMLADAYFGIGLYHYYAAIAPAAAKMLRWLLFLPGGDRAKGLQEILTAGNRGELLAGEADYQLHVLYLWYEHKPLEALDLLASLDRRYSFNPLFLERMAVAEDEYLHDHHASASRWQELVDRARDGRVYRSRATEIGARLGLATELMTVGDYDSAIDHASRVLERGNDASPAARARANELIRIARMRRPRH